MSNLLDDRKESLSKKFEELSESVMSTTLDSLEEESKNVEFNMATEEDKENALKETLGKEYQLSNTDITKVLNVITKMNNNEKFDILSELPLSLSNIIRKLCAANRISNKKLMDEFARDLVNNIINDSNMSAEINNFNKVIKENVDMPASLISLYSDSLKDYMDNKIPKIIEDIKDKDPNNAEKLKKIAEVYKKSYVYKDIFIAAIKDRKVRPKDIDLIDFDKYCLNFDRAIGDSIFTMSCSIKDVLTKVYDTKGFFDNFEEKVIKRLIILICKYCNLRLNMKDIYDQAYAYYMATNIVNFQFTEKDKMTDFEKSIYKNVSCLLDYLKSFPPEVKVINNTIVIEEDTNEEEYKCVFGEQSMS